MSKETSSHPKKYSELNFPYTRKNKKGMGIFHIPDERGMKALLYPKHSLLTPPPLSFDDKRTPYIDQGTSHTLKIMAKRTYSTSKRQYIIF